MYEKILKPIFFWFDPEHVHDFFTWVGAMLGAFAFTRWIVAASCDYEHPSLATRVLGIDFKNPIGLGAGFDKDVQLTKIMPAVGFGFMEVGAITHFPYEGNKGLRLASLPDDQSLIVYYGLKNTGAEAIEKRLKRMKFTFPVGINIAKTNRADIKGEKSVEDYVATYTMLARYFSYVTLNVSCPNTKHGGIFFSSEPAALAGLVGQVRAVAKRPLIVKLSPNVASIQPFAKAAEEAGADALSLVNTFISLAIDIETRRPRIGAGFGGLSGPAIKPIALRMVYEAAHVVRIPVIGLGGIASGADAAEFLIAGARAVQVGTANFADPTAPQRIAHELDEVLEKLGVGKVSDLVGTIQFPGSAK